MFSFLKQRKPNCSPKKVLEVFLVITMICFITTGAVYDASVKQVTVILSNVFTDSYESLTVRTRQDTVENFLKDENITIAENQVLNVSAKDELKNASTIEIRTGKNISILADGNTHNVLATEKTVGDALIEAGVTLGQFDRTEPTTDALISDNMTITVRRIIAQSQTLTQAVPSPVVTVDDPMLWVGEQETVPGVAGVEELNYRVLYENGQEIGRDLVSTTMITPPTETIVKKGTKYRPMVTTVSGKKLAYSRKIEVLATAYDTSLEENGGYTKTAYGLTPGYGIVAVDPRVIPLGTKLYIESPDGGKSWSYGECIAGDTGGAIKGNRIDLCYYTQGECVQFGRRSATVYVLD